MNSLTPSVVWKAIRRAQLGRVLAVYFTGSFIALQVVSLFTDRIGLPEWVFPVAIVLLVVGLPIVVATALVQSAHHALPEAGEHAPPGEAPSSAPGRPAGGAVEPAPGSAGGAAPGETGRTGAGEAGRSAATGPGAPAAAGTAPGRHWLTWRRALFGGVLAFAAFGLFVAGYMLLRNLGVGPAGTLVAKGLLDERDQLIVADFQNRTADSLLGPAVTEAFRIDLAQSPVIRVVDPSGLRQALARMEVDPSAPLDSRRAQEVAIREGIKAYIDGEVNAAGTGYVLSARLLAADSANVLAAYRETASDSTEVIPAIDRLSKDLREKIGESLRTIRGGEPLAQATTASLEALRLYSQSLHALDVDGDPDRAVDLLQEAVAKDSAFAMAWRKLGVILAQSLGDEAGATAAITQAYEHRDRLTDRERYITLGTYYQMVTREMDKGIGAYQTLLATYPDDSWALNNLANLYVVTGQFAEAVRVARRAIARDSTLVNPYSILENAQIDQGELDSAVVTQRLMETRLPGHPVVEQYGARLEMARGLLDSAQARLFALREAQGGSHAWRVTTSQDLADVEALRGRFREADRHLEEATSEMQRTGEGGGVLGATLARVGLRIALLEDTAAARSLLDSAVARTKLDSVAPENRPYMWLAWLSVWTDRPGEARRYQALNDSVSSPGDRRRQQAGLLAFRGVLALREGRSDEAIRLLRAGHERAASERGCRTCDLPELGLAYEAAGRPDSAIAVYERFRADPRNADDWHAMPTVLQHLGALYAKAGEAGKARGAYGQLLERWKEAGPELGPRIARIRTAMSALPAGGGSAAQAGGKASAAPSDSAPDPAAAGTR